MRRPLIINGFMATGKSATAHAVANLVQRPLVDIDREIERQSGDSIAHLFRIKGEDHFRSLEHELLQNALRRDDAPVIAVGGGALLERATRLQTIRSAVVVCLRANLDTVLSRLTNDPASRPLAPSPASVERLLELRAPAYAEAHEVIDVDGRSVEALAEHIARVWDRDPLCVAAGSASYSVEVMSGHFEQRLADEMRGATLGFLITDDNVDGLYGDNARRAFAATNVKHTTFRLTPGEEHKTPESLCRIWEHALAAGADRKSRFVGLGGGVATDVAGFAAATWMRGVDWFSAPTTLLGMVDASVGGKTAVDLPGAKNCVGAFWQPRRVLCDVVHLASEPERGFRSALSEVVKTALIGDADLLIALEQDPNAILKRDLALLEELVRRCIAVKARIVSEDEREGGVRASLNLGHTLGHALEAHAGYGTLTHGEAVSLGLVAALAIGERLGVGDEALTRRVTELLNRFGLPTKLAEYPLADAAELIGNDKKRSGAQVRFVLTSEPGRVHFQSLPVTELQRLATSLV